MPKTLGLYLINDILPDGYDLTGPVDKKSLNTVMVDLAKKDPNLYSKVVVKMKKLGDEFSTISGVTVGLDDITPNKDKDKLMNFYSKKLKAAKSDKDKETILLDAQDKFTELSMIDETGMQRMVASGGRGKANQLRAAVTSPVLTSTFDGKILPRLIKNSFSQGLTPGEFWLTANEARKGVVDTQTATSGPGAISKLLSNTLNDVVVTEDDCGTHNGIYLDVDSLDVTDRFVAGRTKGFSYNELVTESKVKAAKARGLQQIFVRSPMTCEAQDGVCSMCMGLDEKGYKHKIGTNVGLRAAQALTEPLTQFALNAKHGGRSKTTDSLELEGYEGAEMFMSAPKSFKNKAILTEEDGNVTNIVKAPQGGNYIYVGTKKYYAGPKLTPLIKKGDKVAKGDNLTNGNIHPKELTKLRGIGAGRDLTVKSLTNIYAKQGAILDRRHYEIFARRNIYYIKVTNGEGTTFRTGDIMQYNRFRKMIARSIREVSIGMAVGETLAKEYLYYTAGTVMTTKMMMEFQRRGIKKITISLRPPEVEFMLTPVSQTPLLKKDPIARLAHRDLRQTLVQAGRFGEKSPYSGYDPIHPFIRGTEFGKGKKGKY